MSEFGVNPLNFDEFSQAEINEFTSTIDRRLRMAKQQSRMARRRR